MPKGMASDHIEDCNFKCASLICCQTVLSLSSASTIDNRIIQVDQADLPIEPGEHKLHQLLESCWCVAQAKRAIPFYGKRNSRFVLVLRETVSSFTLTTLLPSEKRDDLRNALITQVAELRLVESLVSIRVDEARDKCLIVSLNNDGTCQLRKFTQSQFRAKSYAVPICDCYPITSSVSETRDYVRGVEDTPVSDHSHDTCVAESPACGFSPLGNPSRHRRSRYSY